MGPAPAVFFTVSGFFVMNFVCIPSVHAGSRTLWAFSRDDMVPLSKIWYRIDKRTDTPLYAVWMYTTFCIVINLIGLGSSILITAIFNICAIALNWSYCIPILCKLIFGRFDRGPWHLGRFSTIINIWAVVWNGFLSVLFVLPTHRPVTAENVSSLFTSINVDRRLTRSTLPDELCISGFDLCHWLLSCLLVSPRQGTLYRAKVSRTYC